MGAWQTGLIGGVEKRRIVLAEYDPNWPLVFAAHAKKVAAAVPAALRIEHIGSTAVPGLAAKPIVDLIVVVPDSADESAYVPAMLAAGYLLRVREPDWHEHRMFRTPDRDVHAHFYGEGCPEIERNLRFRDRLRSCPEERRRYEQAKRKLVLRDWEDMNAYAKAKTNVIESILTGHHASR